MAAKIVYGGGLGLVDWINARYAICSSNIQTNNPIRSAMPSDTQPPDIKNKRGRPAINGTPLSMPMSVRLTLAELQSFRQAAERIGEAPTRLLRRAVREIVNAEPDLFEDGLIELRAIHRELAATGRTLNQIARHLNAGGALQECIDLVPMSQTVKAAQDAFGRLIKQSQDRWVAIVRTKK